MKNFSAGLLLAVFLAAGAALAAEDGLEKLLASRPEGWAAGEWNFTIMYQDKPVGKMEMEIAETDDGYAARMATVLDRDGNRIEIAGSAKMDGALGLILSERTERAASAQGEPLNAAITAEIKNKTLTIIVKENGVEVERTEAAAAGPVYAGAPALFAVVENISPRRPAKYSFNLYNTEYRKVMNTTLEVTGPAKPLKVGKKELQSWKVTAANATGEMVFLLDAGGRIIRIAAPDEPLVFERETPESDPQK